ncbi:MAG: hypothetical protein ACFE9S_17040 [Candidatus Hermodarchaeota archaeon]
MLKTSYYDYIYKVDGETLKLRPEKMFEAGGVYLIVDKELKLIWIWAGNHSRLFHRYMAANFAGKLKTKKKFYNFKYEVIKQGLEPPEFHIIYKEIKENGADLSYPGQSRHGIVNYNISSTTNLAGQVITDDGLSVPRSVKSRVKKILTEIKEIQMHIKYSLNHIEQRFAEIEKILEK